jgi:hypothetical protein
MWTSHRSAVGSSDWLGLELGLYLWPLEKQDRSNAKQSAVGNPNAVDAGHNVDEDLVFSLFNAVASTHTVSAPSVQPQIMISTIIPAKIRNMIAGRAAALSHRWRGRKWTSGENRLDYPRDLLAARRTGAL